MRIRRPRNISTSQLMVITAVGIISGVYIWKPLFEKLKSEEAQAIISPPAVGVIKTDPVK